MRGPQRGEPSLYSSNGVRKYLNAGERRRFVDAVRQFPRADQLLCLMVMWTGARLSEALAITPDAIDLDARSVSLHTLKRRRFGVVRQVPLPSEFLDVLDRFFRLRARQGDASLARARLWKWSRTTAWRHIKAVLRAANVLGIASTPKALRHTFGVSAFQANVPPHLVQRWLGHASPRTTAIYGDVSGPEERAFADRLWQHWS